MAIAALSTVAIAGCSTEDRAERKGKAAGEEICKAKNADSANEAERHLLPAAADQEADARGNATQQDVNAVVRAVQEGRASLNGNSLAAYDGMLEALASCD